MKTPKPTHALKQGTFSIVLAAAVILIALAVNLLVSLLPHSVLRTDLTDLKLSELSKESLDYLGTLSEDITIYHICITGNEDPTVTDMLSKYEEACDNISIETIDPAVRPTFVGKYTDIALEDNSLIIVGEKRARAVEYYNMFTFELFYSDANGAPVSQGEMSYSDFQTFYQYYSEYFGTYYSYDTLFAGESVTTSAIDYVTTESLPKVYTVTGHGEVELSENLLSGLYSDNIECAELSIMASGIPEDADCIIINSPMTDLAESEATALRSYLDYGGSLILITDPDYLDLPNLMALCNEHGLSAQKGYVKEGSDRFIGQSYMVIPDSTVASQVLSLSGYSTVMPYAHPILISKDDGKEGAVYLEMFKTSENAYLVEETDNGENDGEGESEKAQFDLGVLATFEGSATSSRILWLGSTAFLSDEINSYSTGGNYLYFISLVEKMTGKSSSLSVVSKKLVEDSLVINFAQVCFWSAIFCAVIPLTVVIIGGVCYVKRRNR